LQGSNFVWVVSSGKATKRQVELGVRTPGFVEVKDGVHRNEQVVVGGQERLAEGAPVQIKLVDRRPLGGQEESATAARRDDSSDSTVSGGGDADQSPSAKPQRQTKIEASRR